MNQSHLVFHNRDIMQVLGKYLVITNKDMQNFTLTCKLWHDVYYTRLFDVKDLEKALIHFGKNKCLKRFCLVASKYPHRYLWHFLALNNYDDQSLDNFIKRFAGRELDIFGDPVFYSTGVLKFFQTDSRLAWKVVLSVAFLQNSHLYADLITKIMTSYMDEHQISKCYNLLTKMYSRAFKVLLPYFTVTLEDMRRYNLPGMAGSLDGFEALCLRYAKTTDVAPYDEVTPYSQAKTYLKALPTIVDLDDAFIEVYFRSGFASFDNFTYLLFGSLSRYCLRKIPQIEKIIMLLIHYDFIDPWSTERHRYGVSCKCYCTLFGLSFHKGFENLNELIMRKLNNANSREHIKGLVCGARHGRIDQCNDFLDNCLDPRDLEHAKSFFEGIEYQSTSTKMYVKILETIDGKLARRNRNRKRPRG